MVRAAAGSLVGVEGAAVTASPLLRCVEGDRNAWRQLHRQYHPVAGAFLRKLGVNEPD